MDVSSDVDEPRRVAPTIPRWSGGEALQNVPGGVIVASHDRFFIDKVANRLLIFDRPGHITLFEGSWSQWQAVSG